MTWEGQSQERERVQGQQMMWWTSSGPVVALQWPTMVRSLPLPSPPYKMSSAYILHAYTQCMYILYSVCVSVVVC